MTEILNRAADNLCSEGWDEEAAAVRKAADEIERMQNVQTSYFGMIIQLIEHAREQAEEIEQLRAALREAIEWGGHDAEGVEAIWLEQARAALTGEKAND